ncbi:SapC family protein [Hyphomonas sp.]|uniref:SapC family protein n=1 Tax=Hyphomonas sp. TaxID=87 RepID=UPI003529801F
MNTPPAAGQTALTGQVLFYKQPQPLSLEDHAGLGIKQIDQPLGFMREAHAIPLAVQEFGLAAGSYPIIFVGDERTPVAVMGLRQGQNLYIDANGRIVDDHYVPAFARRYPFVFANDDNAERLILCVDRQAPMVTNQPEVPFFENGQPSKFTNDAIEFCKEFERQRRATSDFVKLIRDFDLFEEKAVTFQPNTPDGSAVGEAQKLADYWAISEERLNNLPDDKYLELKASGALGAIYSHFISLLNWQRVIQRATRTPPPAEPAPQAANA